MGINLEEGKTFLQDEKWMALAIEQALLAQAIDEVPVGAILVQDNQL
ncbi:MAG TPA: tRNA adenosine(34) deaminase TadA, partial [Candidatus Thioglobus sp.]|nr:tRNA adenosine(34) deaminase TadA [Candidatus Thioglobus sp.]